VCAAAPSSRIAGSEGTHFGLPTVELSKAHSSSPVENKLTVSGLIHSVLSTSGVDSPRGGARSSSSADSKSRLEREIEVDVARQEESYTTLFERDSVRPFVASYQKVTETELSLHVAASPSLSDSPSDSPATPSSPAAHHISQTEYKCSRHVFIWNDIPQLSTKDYIQKVYQNYLDTANELYATLKQGK
jgi:hypothetical protein